MAFSGKYFCGCLKDSPTQIDKVPLYYLKSDILPYCDKAIKVSAPDSYLGYLWAGAIDPSVNTGSGGTGYKIVTNQSSTFTHNFEGWSSENILDSVVVDGGTYGTRVSELSCTVNFYCSYGAKSDGWCGTRIYLNLDGTRLNNPDHIVKSWEGTHTLSYTVKNIAVGAGQHTLSINIQTHASDGDGAYFRVNWYSFSCKPVKINQVPSIMHTVEQDNKEYILCKNFG